MSQIAILKLKDECVRYLDKSGQLLVLYNESLRYKNSMKSENKQVCEDFEPPLRILIQIDLVHLIDMSDLLGRLLLEEPLVVKQVIQEVVHLSVKALGQLPSISVEQVQVTIRLQSFPSVPDVCMGPNNEVKGLVRMQGVLVARTAPGKYVVSAVYRCPVATCKNSSGRRSTRLLATSPRCRLCGSDLEEVPRARDIGDQVVGFLLPHGALTAGAKGRHQALMVCFTDDLTFDLELGVDYSVVGYHDSDMFHAWRVSRWRSPYAMLTHELPLIVLPPAIHQLYLGVSECSPQSPWLFVASLAACIGSDFYPGDTFLHLKLGLLLSLASQGWSRPVPVLAVGEETLVASRLMCRAGALAQRYVSVTSLGLFSSVGGVEHVDDNKSCWCEAGALLFSATGVCHLGDWAKLKQATARSHILSAVESGEVPIGTTGLLASGPSSATSVYPLRSSVWTYQAPPRGNKPSERAQLKTLINVFGIPFLCDLGLSSDQVTHQILQSAVEGYKRKRALPDSEMKEYLAMVSERPVKLTHQASRLIRSYFVASRRLRPDCLPVGAINTITSLSEAHARLAMHSTVGYDDVLAILYLYEESMAAMFGPSYIAPPLTTAHYADKPLYVKIDSRMKDFKVWANQNIKSLLGELDEEENRE